MLIAVLGCLAGLFVIGFTHLDVVQRNQYLEKENDQLNKQIGLLSEQVIKREDDLFKDKLNQLEAFDRLCQR